VAAYPQTIAQLIKEGSEEYVKVTDVTESDDGTPKIRVRSNTSKKIFEVAHHVNDTDKATLIAFYEANKLVTFDFTYQMDGVSYSPCIFYGEPKIKAVDTWWDITMYVRQS
jgi:hypothetical protein